MEIKEIKEAASKGFQNWHKFYKRREIEIINNAFPIFSGHTLEIGAGDGGQSEILAKYCKSLICTEKYEYGNIGAGGTFKARNIPNVKYMLCDAEDLSCFENESFDLIFSSNVLEHIPDVSKCLLECKRVLKPEGVMVHIVPSRTWKVFNSLLFCLKGKKPKIHGVSNSNFREYIEFGKKQWKVKFDNNGLSILKKINLPFVTGHGIDFLNVVIVGNILKLSSSTVFILKKTKKK